MILKYKIKKKENYNVLSLAIKVETNIVELYWANEIVNTI